MVKSNGLFSLVGSLLLLWRWLMTERAYGLKMCFIFLHTFSFQSFTTLWTRRAVKQMWVCVYFSTSLTGVTCRIKSNWTKQLIMMLMSWTDTRQWRETIQATYQWQHICSWAVTASYDCTQCWLPHDSTASAAAAAATVIMMIAVMLMLMATVILAVMITVMLMLMGCVQWFGRHFWMHCPVCRSETWSVLLIIYVHTYQWQHTCINSKNNC